VLRVALVVALLVETARASPNVPLDDPLYERLAQLQATGAIEPFSGGFLPLSRARIVQLSIAPPHAVPTSWWVVPTERVRLRGAVYSDDLRPYTTIAKLRHIAGGIAVSCDYQEGRTCGEGAGIVTELDSSAGYASYISATLRLSAQLGVDTYDASTAVERAYVNAELGPVAVEVGRDTFVLGPHSRTQLAWSRHAPPVDHVRASSAQPVQIVDGLRANATYILARLRAPQAFAGNVASITRVQADLASLELGIQQTLILGGATMPLTIADFFLEHVRRGDASATASDTSNRRFGGDVSARIIELGGLRLYYQLMFEDIRRARFIDAVRYDADHLVGLEFTSLGARTHGLTLEWHKTGVRSHEHYPRTTGSTNAGRVLGSPLGPDAQGVFAGARIELWFATMFPWVELIRSHSDDYEFVHLGPIYRAKIGVTERRYRIGTRMRAEGPYQLRLELEGFVEHVRAFDFESAAAFRNHFGFRASVLWEAR
jgi:hypothetical protein